MTRQPVQIRTTEKYRYIFAYLCFRKSLITLIIITMKVTWRIICTVKKIHKSTLIIMITESPWLCSRGAFFSSMFFWIWSFMNWIQNCCLFMNCIFRFLLIIMFFIQTLIKGLYKFYWLLFSFTSAGLYVIKLKMSTNRWKCTGKM